MRNTQPSQDATTNQIWDSFLKEYIKWYAPDTKPDGPLAPPSGMDPGSDVVEWQLTLQGIYGTSMNVFWQVVVKKGLLEKFNAKIISFGYVLAFDL